MDANHIAEVEAQFDLDGRDSQGLEHTMKHCSLSFSDAIGTTSLNYIDAGLSSGTDSFFYPECVDKDQITLHYTVGYLPGDIANLSKADRHVSVPFVIGRNGHIYNLFPSQYWAYHLGRGAVGGNTHGSRRTIAIELSNIGPLQRIGNHLHTSYGDHYCHIEEKELYFQRSFRGFDYFASFTEAQYQSLNTLLRYLTQRYQIPRVLLDESLRYQCLESIPEFRGIATHVNYRASGKTDLGPAFEWSKVIEGLGASTHCLRAVETEA